MTQPTTPAVLVDGIEHAKKITDAGVSFIARASVAPTQVLTGLLTGTAGLAACIVFGVTHPDYALLSLDVCSFLGSGVLGLLGSRLFGPAKRREDDESKRAKLNFGYQTAVAQADVMKSLQGVISPSAMDAFAGRALLTFDSLGQIASKPLVEATSPAFPQLPSQLNEEADQRAIR